MASFFIFGPRLTLTLSYASGAFCLLLITFANSLDPDQDRNSVGPDLDPNDLTLWCFEKVSFEKSQQTTAKA